jgi:hypothetical protein
VIIVLGCAIWLDLTRAELGVMIGTLVFILSVILDERPSFRSGAVAILLSLSLFFVAFLAADMKLNKLLLWITVGDDPPYLLGVASGAGTIGILAIISAVLLPKDHQGAPSGIFQKRFK